MMTTTDNMISKRTGFSLKYRETGERLKWYFWHDRRKPATWFFVDHEGYERFAGETWAEAVVTINQTADAYGCDCNIS